MVEEVTYPFTDDLMRWDESTNRYILTEEALIRNGVDMRARLASGKATSPEYVINGFLNRVSTLIYAYIHKYNVNTEKQDQYIKEIPSLRTIMFNAMTSQAIYMAYNGDLSISPKEDERRAVYDMVAMEELDRYVPELGHPITYAGVI